MKRLIYLETLYHNPMYMPKEHSDALAHFLRFEPNGEIVSRWDGDKATKWDFDSNIKRLVEWNRQLGVEVEVVHQDAFVSENGLFNGRYYVYYDRMEISKLYDEQDRLVELRFVMPYVYPAEVFTPKIPEYITDRDEASMYLNGFLDGARHFIDEETEYYIREYESRTDE